MSEKHRIVANTLGNGLAQFAGMASAVVFMPLLIREFGQTRYGLFLLASSISSYASLIDFGVSVALVKNVAERSAVGDREGLSKHVSTALIYYICAGLLVATGLCAVAVFAGSLFKVSSDDERLLRNLLFMVAGSSLLTWPASTGGLVLGGLQRYTLSARTALFAVIANIGVTIAVLLLHKGPLALLVGQSAVAVAAAAFNLALAKRELADVRIHPSSADFGVFKEILRFSWVLFVLSICGAVIYQQTDRVVLGVFLGAAAITLYESAAVMQGLVMAVGQFATSAVMPYATQLNAEGRFGELQTLFLRGTKYVMALVLPVVVALMILARPIITVWLGRDFADQAIAAQILLSFQLLGVGAMVGEHILAAKGQARKRIFNSIFVLALGNLVLSLALVRPLGVLGVVIGTAVPWFVDFPARLRVVLKEVDVPFRDWLSNSAGPVYLSTIATILVATVLRLTPLVDSLWGLAVAGAMSVGASWGALLVFAVTQEEREDVRGIVSRMVGTWK